MTAVVHRPASNSDMPVYGSLLAQPSSAPVSLAPGDFVAVDVESATTASLTGVPVSRTTIAEFHLVYGGGVSASAATHHGDDSSSTGSHSHSGKGPMLETVTSRLAC